MQTLTDPQLLRAYAEDHSEAAFGELVRRHIDLTYSVALRIVRDPHLAEDATQAVFVALAHNAGKLSEHPVLSGWLHCAARNVASQMVRSEVRRRAREQEAARMHESPDTEAPWDTVEPHLDSVLSELEPAERDAVLLRYFERKSAREMADQLGISAEAAQKRVSRAVEHLRSLFARRGIAVSTGGLVLLMTQHAVQAAPAGLATSIITSATLATSAAADIPMGDTALIEAGIAAPAATPSLLAPLVSKLLVGGAALALSAVTFHATMQNRSLRRQVEALQGQLTRSPGSTNRLPPRQQLPRTPIPIDGPDAVAAPGPAFSIPEPALAGGKLPSNDQLRQSVEAFTTRSIASMGTGPSGGGQLEALTVNGSIVIRYGGRDFPLGALRGPVTTRAVQLQGREFAAAFDGDRVVWENTPGAARQIR